MICFVFLAVLGVCVVLWAFIVSVSTLLSWITLSFLEDISLEIDETESREEYFDGLQI